MNTLRPSSLPKIAACSKWVNAPFEVSPPAQRGTLMDEAYRESLQGNQIPLNDLDDSIAEISETLLPGREAVEWAVERTKLIAGSHTIISNEKELHVDIPHLPQGGTLDANVPGIATGIDLKSGQIRNYLEQMAAYALGSMRKYFEDRYTMHLIFCDQREVVTHEFTETEAEVILVDLRDRHLSPESKATPCAYCTWCGAKEECGARRQLATNVGALNVQEKFELILENPDQLSEFLIAANALQDYVDRAKKKALELIEDGQDIAGYKRVKGRKGAEYMPSTNAVNIFKKEGITIDQVMDVVGNLSKNKFEKIIGTQGADYNYVRKPDGRPYLSKR